MLLCQWRLEYTYEYKHRLLLLLKILAIVQNVESIGQDLNYCTVASPLTTQKLSNHYANQFAFSMWVKIAQVADMNVYV
jgi:hypothetical protein